MNWAGEEGAILQSWAQDRDKRIRAGLEQATKKDGLFLKMHLTSVDGMCKIISVACVGTLGRGVAQSGSARALGAWGRGFESLHPDQKTRRQAWLLGQVVKTPPFHGGYRGSNPLGVTIFPLMAMGL